MKYFSYLVELRIGALLACLVLIAGKSSSAVAQTSTGTQDWEFGGEVYLFGASIGGNSVNGGDIDIPFHELLDDLDMAFMGALGARRGKLTLAMDMIYLNVEERNDKKISLPVSPDIGITGDTDVKLKGFVGTPTVRYALLDGDRGRMNILGGARYLWLDASISVSVSGERRSIGAKISDSGSVWDGIVGIEGEYNLSPRWYLSFYLDGGAGESDSTWQSFAGAGYRCNTLDFVFGYRYMDWDFDGEHRVFNDLDLGGPIAGIKFSF